jgi:hypothetical protein
MAFIIIKLKLRQEKLAMDLFTYRDKISQPLTACKRNPGVCAYTQNVIGKLKTMRKKRGVHTSEKNTIIELKNSKIRTQ